MRPWTRWLYVISGLVVAVSSIALAVRQGSWAPIISVGWIPAVVVAVMPGRRRRCLPRRRSQAG
jgi:ribose/xylose/arabinose/galactoside ABC-type transport system permease subunit